MALTISGTNNIAYLGAVVSDLTIQQSGTGTLNVGNDSYPTAIMAGSLTLESGTVNATGGTANSVDSMGVHANNINVKGGTLNAKGGTTTASNYHSIGIYVIAGTVTVSGGTLNATGGTSGFGSYGVCADQNGTVTVSGGTLNATGGIQGDGSSNGITAGTVKYSGGTIRAKGNTEASDYEEVEVSVLSTYYYRMSTSTAEPTSEALTGTGALFTFPKDSIKFLGLYATNPDVPAPSVTLQPTPSTSSTPYVPPVTIPSVSGGSANSPSGIIAAHIRPTQLPSGVMPADVVFRAEPQPPTAAPVQAAQATLGAQPSLPNVRGIAAYDLDFVMRANGEKVNFTGNIGVSIPIPLGFGSFLRVFHVADDGTMTEVPAVISGSNILLTLDHFSYYAIVDFASPAGKLPAKLTAGANAPATSDAAKPSASGNTAQNPKTGAAIPVIPAVLVLGGLALVACSVARKKTV